MGYKWKPDECSVSPSIYLDDGSLILGSTRGGGEPFEREFPEWCCTRLPSAY